MPAPLGFLRPRPRREGPITVSRATEGDFDEVEKLLATSPYSYAGLGGAMSEAVHDDLALVARQENDLVGFILAHQQGPRIAWIYALGVGRGASLDEVSQALLAHLLEQAREKEVHWLAYMDEYNLTWLRRLLEKEGFARETRVIGFEAPAQAPPEQGNMAVQVRPAYKEDLAEVARVDRAAFGEIWAYTERVLAAVLDQVGLFLVAEQEGRIVGYVLCTLHEGVRAHVVRLAVDPSMQGQKVGVRLLAEAFDYFRGRGVRWISLNTQEENIRSQQLYRWFGFRPTGDAVGVWVVEVDKIIGVKGRQDDKTTRGQDDRMTR